MGDQPCWLTPTGGEASVVALLPRTDGIGTSRGRSVIGAVALEAAYGGLSSRPAMIRFTSTRLSLSSARAPSNPNTR